MRTLTLTALSVVLLLGFVEAATTPAGAVPLGNIATSSDPPPTRARSILEKVGWRDGYGYGYGYGYYGGPRYYYGSYYPSYRYSYGSYYPSYGYSSSGYYPSYGDYGWRRW
jgi:hypothetical protein